MALTRIQLRRLAAVVQRVAGRDVGVVELVRAMEEESPDGIYVSQSSMGSLRRLVRHKHLIDSSARLSLRIHGHDSPVSDGYPIYVARAQMEGLEPVSLKTYKNRALGRWLEVV